jgi:hypothetical protein
MNTDLALIFKKTVQLDESEHIAIKPLCDFFGVNYKHQAHRFKNDRVLQQLSRKNKTVAGDLKERYMISVHKHGFLIWIAGISSNLVDANLREKFIQYQLHIHEYFERIQGDASYYQRKFKELKDCLETEDTIAITRTTLRYRKQANWKRIRDILDDQLQLQLEDNEAH